MANLLNEKENPKPPPPAEDPALRAARAEGFAQRLAQENAELQRRELARLQGRTEQPAAPAGPDPFATLAGEHLTATPDDFARNLDAGTRRRVREELGPILTEMDRRNQAARIEDQSRMALTSIMQTNPDVASDYEGFAAATAKAGIRAQNMGLNMAGPEMAQFALSIYREDHPRPTPEPPVLEGAGGPSGAPRKPEAPKGKSVYEQFYGKGAGDELHEEAADMSAFLTEYGDKRQEFLEKAGVPVEFSGIQQVVGQDNERKARKVAAGA